MNFNVLNFKKLEIQYVLKDISPLRLMDVQESPVPIRISFTYQFSEFQNWRSSPVDVSAYSYDTFVIA